MRYPRRQSCAPANCACPRRGSQRRGVFSGRDAGQLAADRVFSGAVRSRVHWPRSLEGLEIAVDGRYGNTRRKGIYLLPNLVTTGGLFAGFYSIVASIDGNFEHAAWAIFAAMLLDGLDGRVARLTSTCQRVRQGVRQSRGHGVVRFGARHRRLSMGRVSSGSSGFGARIWGRLVWLATFLYVAAAAFRLARFNSNVAQDRRFFQGLASPAAAAGVASMIWVATAYDGLRRARGARRRRHDHGRHGFADDVAVRVRELQGLQSRPSACGSRSLLLIPLVIIVIAHRAARDDLRLVRRLRRIGAGRLVVAPRRGKRHDTVTP